MWIDLETDVIWDHEIYRDGDCAILWSARHGETMHRHETTLWPREEAAGGELPFSLVGFLRLPRFWQLAPETIPPHPVASGRYVQLALYAHRNGGQILTHIEPPTPAERAGRWVRGLWDRVGWPLVEEPTGDPPRHG